MVKKCRIDPTWGSAPTLPQRMAVADIRDKVS